MEYQRWEILNDLVDAFGYTSYLEIGVQDPMRCFNKIKVPNKVSVDPAEHNKHLFTHNMTSDEFFEQNDQTFDLIFIDGLHLSEQVHKDILNSLNVLNPNGTIMCHDMNPKREIVQRREQVILAWTGDCWKTWVWFMQETETYGIEMHCIKTDMGCGIIRRGKQKPITVLEELNWEGLQANRKDWLNLTPVEQLPNLIRSWRNI
jgi:hypothetical protein